MECCIGGVLHDLDVAVLKILDDEVDDDDDDKDNDKDGGRVGRGRQVSSPSSYSFRYIVWFILKPIGGTASHRYGLSLQARS